MLGSNPRPVPSKAALRVLYQLAYISSGTAVGVATLCAEERRRRTQLVQTVADNAKRIRQSPRYYQNAALAVQAADDHVVGHGGVERAPELQRDWRDGTERLKPGHIEQAIRGPELPSVVESGYARARKQEGGRKRGPVERRRTPRIIVPSQGFADGTREPALLSRAVRHRHGTTQSSPPSPAPNTVGAPGDAQIHAWSQDNLAYKTYKRISRRPSSPLAPEPSSVSLLSRRIGQPLASTSDTPGLLDKFRISAIRKATVDKNFAYGKPNVTEQFNMVLAEDITHDVEYFFDCMRSLGNGNQYSSSLTRIANRLLHLAVEHGQLDDIRSLYMWKLSTNTFPELDARILCEASHALSLRIDRHELFDFYSDVFSGSRFQLFDLQGGLRLGISVLTEALGWSVHDKPEAVAHELLGPLLRASSRADLTTLLAEECQALRAGGHVQCATDLVISLCSYCCDSAEFAGVFDATFKAAIEAGLLSSCTKLLRLTDSLALDHMKEYRDTFLAACDARGAYGLVLDLFATKTRLRQRLLGRREGRRDPEKMLSAKGFEILAFACTKSNDMLHTPPEVTHWLFRGAYSRVPEAMRGRIIQSRSILRLKELWWSTHDVSKVRQSLEVTTKWLRENGTEQDHHALALAELEIYISANQLDLALTTIARIHGTQTADGHTVSLAAVLFAKKGAWDSLERLLAIAQDSSMLKFNADTSRRFNNVFRLYANQHSAVETWKFVSAAITDLGFLPDHATTEIMLEAFVAHKNTTLISKWLRYLQTIGRTFELTSGIAAKLLSCYYLDHRPSHVLIMWFCRNLAHAAPSLAGPEFVGLIKEAIGYNLRKATGQYATWQRASARLRLASLDETSDLVPSPGYRWNGQLYLKQPKEVTAPQLKPSSGHSVFRGITGLVTNGAADIVNAGVTPLEDSKSAPPDHFREKPAPAEDDSANTNADAGDATSRLLAAFNAEPQSESDGQASSTQPEDIDLPSMIQFGDLRSSYADQKPQPDTEAIEPVEYVDMTQSQATQGTDHAIERDMVLALSLAQYVKVIELYHSSLDAVGLPASPLALEVATEASLRLHRGDRTLAEGMMRKARDAGMNVTCAMGPMLIHQMYHLNSADKKDVNNLRVSVIDYYRMNDENGWPVKHHVGITAANLLIDNRRPEHGVNILDAIYRSEWAVNRPLDIVAMTVFLKGYAALRSMDGTRWVVTTVLGQGMRIDQKFLATLRAAMKRFAGNVRGRVPRSWAWENEKSPVVPILVGWIQQCHERRAKQMLDSKLLGKKLVACLAYCANEQQQRPIDASARGELEDALFGKRLVPLGLLGPDSGVASRRPRYIERLKSRVARAIRAEQDLHCRGPRVRAPGAYHRRWIGQYRAFLRQNLMMPDGKLASFRYRLANGPEQRLSRRQRSIRPGYQVSHYDGQG